ncbi:hypothetical protein OG730_41415 (plasmid) [Streptomyces sp. NBC_01298]|uniref:hypothetical protein n=1 Tax=Streptomyces sp. NBC_01298 TaxID=2903817 RepID=UPI002E0DCAA1|nr:hypothetical protein OG730_42610 [Streptomyces sp. NBC_01298]WSK25929.1 hypothetical protein OG730_41415 [Streptomyces sp. NBC_01298]
MASEPVNTPIQSKYAEQLAADLASNQAEQATLTARLSQLHAEEKWLTAAMESMPPVGDAPAPTGADLVAAAPVAVGVAEAAVPKPRANKKADGAGPAKKTAAKKTAEAPAKKTAAAKKAPAKKTAAAKNAAATVPAVEEAVKPSEPTLGQLLSDVLSLQPGEPKKVTEIRTELEAAHPERAKSDPVVRAALEKLATKGVLEKSNQQGTVFYTWPKASAPAAEVPAQENAEAVPAGA